MKWKVGDRVRITGREWGTDEKDSTHEGAVLEVAGVRDGGIQFETDGYLWSLHEGWEIELVEREEETMSVDFSDVNVGDRVRLTRENGDETTFTVEARSELNLESRSDLYYRSEWDTLEIVERAFKPVPGLYTNDRHDRAVLLENGKMYYTASQGVWITVGADSDEDILREERGWKREITF